ncbi:hypothetical protein CERZMDRAFT_39079, partial [Cercospora zeae-maydis SCOH1-5]
VQHSMARFAANTTSDSSASVWVVTILAISYSCLTLGTRVYFRSSSWVVEDNTILAATILACGEYGATMYAANHGVGLSLALLSESDRHVVNTTLRASHVLFFIALTLSKLSVTLLMLRIFSNLQSRLASAACTSVTVAVIAWGVASTLATSVGCEPAPVRAERGEQICPGYKQRWLTITVAACIIETSIAALPALLCINLRMDFGKKVKVFLAFAFRLGYVISMTVLEWGWLIFKHSCAFFAAPLLAEVVVWQQSALCYSLLSATIPVSLNFISQFATGASAALSTARKSSTLGSSIRFGNLSLSGKSKFSGSTVSEPRGTFARQTEQIRHTPKRHEFGGVAYPRNYAFQLPKVEIAGVIPDLPD